jgi:hypothetical protein
MANTTKKSFPSHLIALRQETAEHDGRFFHAEANKYLSSGDELNASSSVREGMRRVWPFTDLSVYSDLEKLAAELPRVPTVGHAWLHGYPLIDLIPASCFVGLRLQDAVLR